MILYFVKTFNKNWKYFNKILIVSLVKFAFVLVDVYFCFNHFKNSKLNFELDSNFLVCEIKT